MYYNINRMYNAVRSFEAIMPRRADGKKMEREHCVSIQATMRTATISQSTG